jgi:quercetin dioxygenase-like cupin family protein
MIMGERKRTIPQLSMLHGYPDESGVTHSENTLIELMEVDYAPPAPHVFMSKPRPATALAYLWVPAGWDGGWHPSPHAQTLVVLKGTVEVVTGDGTKRLLKTGDFTMFEKEPAESKGHMSRAVGKEPVLLAVIMHPDPAPAAPAK